MRLEEFRWGTRREVCEQLLRLALENSATPAPEDNGPYNEPNPGRARSLLQTLVDHTCEMIMRQLPVSKVTDSADEEVIPAWVAELHHLLRRESVTPADLEALRNQPGFEVDETIALMLPELFDLLCQSAGASQAKQNFLLALSPMERARVLIQSAQARDERLTPDLEEWLYRCWLDHDRMLLDRVCDGDAPANLEVIVATRWYPESRAMLLERWPELVEEQKQKLIGEFTHNLDLEEEIWERIHPAHREWELSRGELDESLLAECLANEPARMAGMVDTLALPLSLLLKQIGTDALFISVEAKIRAASRALQEEGARSADVYTDELWRTFNLLEKWPGEEVNARIQSLYQCPDVDRSLKRKLRYVIWDRLWKQSPLEALAAARQAAEAGDDHWAQLATNRMGRHPRPEYRDSLLWAAGQDSVRLRYTAVQALESLQEDSREWREQLIVLAGDPHPAVRLQATAALVRRGEDSRLTEIVREATTAEKVEVRAEALRMLGDLDAAQHFPLLRSALLDDHAVYDQYHLPAAEEAALALARLGTPAGLAALVRAALTGPHILWASIAWYLEAFDPFGALAPDLPMFIYGNWRQGRHWRA
jgi:HEAT repeat protein